MGRRALRGLRNLGKWAISTTKKTYIEKIKKGIKELTERPSGKENAKMVCHLAHADAVTIDEM